jgi:pimeloyl-ACP methyl ester carboxylesterase
MTAETKRLTLCNGLITGLASTGGKVDLPLLVMLPGGGGNAALFNMPNRSFLATAAANGFSAIALNRPAQGDSAPLDVDRNSDTGVFAANAQRLLSAIDEIWRTESAHPGVIIYGSSIGGAITLHMAAEWSKSKRPWPLLGVSVADIGQVAPPILVDAWRSLPPVDTINLADHFAIFFAGVPPWAMPRRPPPQPQSPPLALHVPRAELQEVVGGWVRDWESMCSKISVPVQYRLAKHDTPWLVSEQFVQEFTDALRKASPYVESAIVPGAMHVICNSPVAASHMLDVLSFASRCAVAVTIPQVLER